MDPVREIEVLIRAKYPIIWITSWEERRVEEALERVAKKLDRKLHTWSVTQGMKPEPKARIKKSSLPGELEALAQVHEAPEFTIFLLKDFHQYMRDSRVVRLLRDLAGRLRGRSQTLLLLSPTITLPVELEKEVTMIEFLSPNRMRLRSRSTP